MSNVAMVTCPHGGAWYMLCPSCNRVSVLSRDAVCRFCGCKHETKEVDSATFERVSNRRY